MYISKHDRTQGVGGGVSDFFKDFSIGFTGQGDVTGIGGVLGSIGAAGSTALIAKYVGGNSGSGNNGGNQSIADILTNGGIVNNSRVLELEKEKAAIEAETKRLLAEQEAKAAMLKTYALMAVGGLGIYIVARNAGRRRR